MCFLTFDHDHVDIYGANGRLGQTLPLLQNVWDFSRGDAVVRLASECHQLPDGHSWRTWRWVREAGVGRRDMEGKESNRGQDKQTDKRGGMQIKENRISAH